MIRVTLIELHGSTELTGELVAVVGNRASVRYQSGPENRRRVGWGDWTVDLNIATGLPPRGSTWAWRASPEALARAVGLWREQVQRETGRRP